MLFDYSGLAESVKKINLSLQGIAGTQYNAILTIAVSTGSQAVIDPTTGNYVLDESSTQEFKAQLRKKSSNPTQDLDIGTPFTRVELEGYFLSPLASDLTLPSKIPCQLLDNKKWLSGSFYPIFDNHSNIDENFQISDALGTPLKGVFELQGNTNP